MRTDTIMRWECFCMLKFFRHVGLFVVVLFLGMVFVDLDAIMPEGDYLQQRLLDKDYIPDLEDLIFNKKQLYIPKVQQSLLNLGYDVSREEIKEAIQNVSNKYPDREISTAGGFLTLSGMLNQHLSELAFLQEDYQWIPDESSGTSKRINVSDKLERGVRYFYTDLGKSSVFSQPTYQYQFSLWGTTPIDTSMIEIREFLRDNPNDIVILHVKDIYYGKTKATESQRKKLVNFYYDKLRYHGLLRYVYNYATIENNQGSHIDTNLRLENIKLLDLIGTNKRIFLISDLSADTHKSGNYGLEADLQDINKANVDQYAGGFKRYELNTLGLSQSPLGPKGNITGQLKRTLVQRNETTLLDEKDLEDYVFIEALDLTSLSNVKITHDFMEPTHLRYYCLHLVGKEKGKLPYSLYGYRENGWHLMKKGTIDFSRERTWFTIVLNEENENLEKIRLDFEEGSDNQGITIAEIAIYNDDAEPIDGYNR